MKREWEMLGPQFPHLPIRDEDAGLQGDGAHEQTAHAQSCTAPAAQPDLGWGAGWLWSPWWEGIDPGGLGFPRSWGRLCLDPERRLSVSRNGNLLEKFANEVRELGIRDRRIQPGTHRRFDLQLKTAQWMAPSQFHNIQASHRADWDPQGLGHPPL